MATTLTSPSPAENMSFARRLLVCVDRSAVSEACVPHAQALAMTFGGAITLVHVMQTADEPAGRRIDALGWEISRQEAHGYLERLRQEVSQASGLPVDVRLEQGRPAERITDLADEIAADLIVLSSCGQGAGPTWNLGTTAQQVLAIAHKSVFIAHSSSPGPAASAFKCILVPLDGSLRAESVLPAAARIAAARAAELVLVHVVQEPLPTAILSSVEDMELAGKLASRFVSGATRYLEQLRQQLAREGTPVRTLVVRHANTRQCLLETAEQEQAELIVLCAHGCAADSGRSFGEAAAHLLTHSKTPLLVLQDLPEHELRRAKEGNGKSSPSTLRASFAPEIV